MAQERKLSASPVSLVAAACVCVGINLTTIETLPIYLVETEPAGAAIELSGGAIPSLTAGNVDVATNAETQAILRFRPPIRKSV